jgi:hypothetical protein
MAIFLSHINCFTTLVLLLNNVKSWATLFLRLVLTICLLLTIINIKRRSSMTRLLLLFMYNQGMDESMSRHPQVKKLLMGDAQQNSEHTISERFCI